MHYKYLNINLRTFVEFLNQSIYALFRPGPACPAGKKAALHIPAKKAQIAQKITSSKNLTLKNSGDDPF